jgi:GTP-binding protein
MFQNASYAFSIAQPGEPLPPSRAEIAFAGRSNAGKSSVINALAGRRRLAFVSKTPGRTQMINYFDLGGGRFLVDLPGYGYAAAPGAVRERWHALVGDYVTMREPLRGLVLVMDIRRPLTDLDLQLIGFFRRTAKPIHVLLTKSDKLARSKAIAVLRDVERELQRLSLSYSAQLFSSLARTGIEEAEAVCAAWLELPAGAPTR